LGFKDPFNQPLLEGLWYIYSREVGQFLLANTDRDAIFHEIRQTEDGIKINMKIDTVILNEGLSACMFEILLTGEDQIRPIKHLNVDFGIY
jgi:hypothetical protein